MAADVAVRVSYLIPYCSRVLYRLHSIQTCSSALTCAIMTHPLYRTRLHASLCFDPTLHTAPDCTHHSVLAPHSTPHLTARFTPPDPTLPCGVTERSSLRERGSVFQEVLLVYLDSVLCEEIAILVFKRLGLMVGLLIAYIVHYCGFLSKGVGERCVFL